MAVYPIAPGAWLSGHRAAHTPIDQRRAAQTPIDQPGASSTPIDNRPPASATPIGPDRALPQGQRVAPTPAPFPLPWEGADPDWSYGSADALLALAMRKSFARVVPRDPDLLSHDDQRRAAMLGRRIDGSHLWRWGPEFRISAVQADLMGRLQVRDAHLWLLDSVAGGAPVQASCVFEAKALPRGKVFQDQIDKVQRAAVEREDRLPEILTQAADFWPFFEPLIGFTLGNRPRLGELLAVAHGVALHVLMALKNGVGALRPFQCSTLIVPVIPTPAHGALPSGHATMAALNVQLLASLLPPGRDRTATLRILQLDALARRIAFNRVVAGVHFPIDSVVGYALGTQLGRLFAALAGAADTWPGVVDGAHFRAIAPDDELHESDASRPPLPPGGRPSTVEPNWHDMWRRTSAELRQSRI